MKKSCLIFTFIISIIVTYADDIQLLRIYHNSTLTSVPLILVESAYHCASDDKTVLKVKTLDSLFCYDIEAVDSVSVSGIESPMGGEPAGQADIFASEDIFRLEDGCLYYKIPSEALMPNRACLFREDVIAVAFTICQLWDSNMISLAFGRGIDDLGNNCFAGCYMNTSVRPEDTGWIENWGAEVSQPASIWGLGHVSCDYRNPQTKPYSVKVGDRCRIELLNGFFNGTVYNTKTKKWEFWFCLDTKGAWNNSERYGWNRSRNIGFAVLFGGDREFSKMAEDVRILARKGSYSEIVWFLSKNYPTIRTWVAIGDSFTEIDENNGLSYVGYAKRLLGWDCINKGKGGWTLVDLWNKRTELGWEDAVRDLKANDVVTIFAGTNDFDTKNVGNHPVLGTIDPVSLVAKDSTTTLGCLRLIIERIKTLNPIVKLAVFSPTYREKGTLIGYTGWEKDLFVNDDGKTIYDYADAITNVGLEYGLPSYNLAREIDFTAHLLEIFTYDDLHPSQAGGELLGNYFADKLRNL